MYNHIECKCEECYISWMIRGRNAFCPSEVRDSTGDGAIEPEVDHTIRTNGFERRRDRRILAGAMTSDTPDLDQAGGMMAGPSREERCMRPIRIAAAAALMISYPLYAMPDAAADASQRANELLAADRSFGEASAKLEGLAGLEATFADNVIVPVPGKDFARGKDEVLAALRIDPAIDMAHIDWSPVRVGISADGSQGFSFGFMNQRQADGPTQAYKYLAYWQRDMHGWKVIAWKRGKRAAGAIDEKTLAPLLPGSFTAGGDMPHLEEAERAFSDQAQATGLGPAFAKFGTANSMNLGGSANSGFVFGAEAIARLVSEGQPAGGSTLNWSADRVVVAASGDLGVSIGHIRFNEAAADGSRRSPIPFFTVWRRAASDQPWRYVAE
jgi:ketosteroid isomerase-like protein